MYDAEAVARYAATDKGRAARYAANKRWRDAHPELKPAFADRKRELTRANPKLKVFADKRSRAKSKGIHFTLIYEDMIWPQYCPVLGIEIDYSRLEKGGLARDNSQSFDRLDTAGGYTPDNVLVVSNRANTLRGAFTPEELFAQARMRTGKAANELLKVATFYATLFSSIQKQSASNCI